jgi:hypothetical protein
MDQLVDQDADRGAAPGAERCAIHQTPLRQQRAPGTTRTERHTEYGNRHGERTHPPAARRVVAACAPDELQQKKGREEEERIVVGKLQQHDAVP